MSEIYSISAKKGMILGESVYGSQEDILLEKGTVLDEARIARLIKLGVRRIKIDDGKDYPFVEEKEIVEQVEEVPEKPEIIPKNYGVSEEIYNESVEIVEELLDELVVKGELTIEHVEQSRKVVNNIVEDIMETRVIIENKNSLKKVNEVIDTIITGESVEDIEMIKSHDEYTFMHSVNVASIAIILGLSFNLDKEKLKKLGMAALLHDLGKVMIPSSLINKPGKLTEIERFVMNKHSQNTYDILCKQSEIEPIIARAAYQHHEKFDGSGYPQGLKGNEIEPFARIIAVADVYDALVTDRSYRKGMMSYEAAEIIQASAYTHFDVEVVNAFMQNIIIYPVGAMVQLNTGEKGVVSELNASMPTRPVVFVAFDAKGQKLAQPHRVDLLLSLTRFIVKVYKDE